MRALVVGYGSIGARHARLLREEGCAVGVVSRRRVEASPSYRSLQEALLDHGPGYVVIANRTKEHAATLRELAEASFGGTVLVEKPIFADVEPLPPSRFENVFVAYNLRFHPGIQRLREALRDEEVLTVQAYVGQHLPSWRPGRDYREVYSAHKSEGGGALRDLSHELDYLSWILGGWRRLVALGGRLSSLKITSDDAIAILAQFGRCPAATIQLNYLDRPGLRAITVNTDRHPLRLNLTESYLEVDGSKQPCEVERDHTYRLQHQAILSGQHADVCTAKEGLHVTRFIKAVEASIQGGAWIPQ